MDKIGLGGGCHWCTEGVFQSLKGVLKVDQGWLASTNDDSSFSEGVIVHFDRDLIDLPTLISVHLHTHSCTSDHTMRNKYRSAIYTFKTQQVVEVKTSISSIQDDFDSPIITKTIPFNSFKLNEENFLNYYQNNPDKPFCQTYINPKIKLLTQKFSKHVNADKL
jgi:peptide-methionine (S)-S-oxide reductase